MPFRVAVTRKLPDLGEQMLNEAERRDDVVAVSALTEEGVDRLREAISRRLQKGSEVHRLRLPLSQGERLAWLHSRGEVLESQVDGEEMQVAVRLSPDNWARFQAL